MVRVEGVENVPSLLISPSSFSVYPHPPSIPLIDLNSFHAYISPMSSVFVFLLRSAILVYQLFVSFGPLRPVTYRGTGIDF